MIPSVDLIEPRRRRLTRWIGAATLIVALHLGGGSVAMLYWQEEFVEEAPGAIVVEIAPIATALATDTLDLPPGQLSDEREATQIGGSIPRSPRSRRRRRKRICRRRSRKSRRTSPRKRRARRYASPRSRWRPPRPRHRCASMRKSSTKSAAPEVGTAASNARSSVSWQNSVVLHLNRHKRYPATARMNDMQGDVNVRFSMDRSGQLMASQVVRSSGFALLDEEALELLKRASPLPRPPPWPCRARRWS